MASGSADKCPVDHSSLASSSKDACPVDHSTRSSWTSVLGRRSQDGHGAAEHPDTPAPPANLPLDRETSSIPREDGSNWVYPSQAQFFAAMARKNHNPNETDMKVVVPIHNAVNERAWQEIMKWEANQGGEKCGGVKLISFKGRPNDRSPRARWYSLLGYISVLTPSNHDRLISVFSDTLRLSTATTGLSNAVVHACAMSSTSTPATAEQQTRGMSLSSSTYGQHLTDGKVSVCAPSDFGSDGPAAFGDSQQSREGCNQNTDSRIFGFTMYSIMPIILDGAQSTLYIITK